MFQHFRPSDIELFVQQIIFHPMVAFVAMPKLKVSCTLAPTPSADYGWNINV